MWQTELHDHVEVNGRLSEQEFLDLQYIVLNTGDEWPLEPSLLQIVQCNRLSGVQHTTLCPQKIAEKLHRGQLRFHKDKGVSRVYLRSHIAFCSRANSCVGIPRATSLAGCSTLRAAHSGSNTHPRLNVTYTSLTTR